MITITLSATLCILLCLLGHLVRDGFPATGHTHVARAVGGFMCLCGALAVAPPLHALAFGLAIYAGFYFDMKHGDGQGADDLASEGFLALSGITSLMPLAATAVIIGDHRAAALVFIGIVKPIVWTASQVALRRYQPNSWLQPTRVSAMVFGAIVGAILVLIA